MSQNTGSEPALVIAVGGGSGSGKTTFACRLKNALTEKTKIISLDAYYRDTLPRLLSPLNGKIYDDWNCPEAIDLDRVLEEIDRSLTEQEFLIVEGIGALYYTELLKRADVKLFIDLPAPERMMRRVRRNRQGGLSLEEITEYYLNAASVQEQKYCLPTREAAEIILNGRHFDTAVSMIALYAKSRGR